VMHTFSSSFKKLPIDLGIATSICIHILGLYHTPENNACQYSNPNAKFSLAQAPQYKICVF
jgi:hypothetical protein